MTAKEAFEGMLIELSKVKAPSLLLEEFNYLFNKVIRQFTERQYGNYDINQNTSDSLRVLKSTALLTPVPTKAYDDIQVIGDSYLSKINNDISNLYGNIYEINLPDDYLHMLNCICIFKVKKNHKCYNAGSYVQFPASRLDSDKWSQIINDYYNRPLPTRPYFFIHNVNTSEGLLTNPYNPETETGTDQLIFESQQDDITNDSVQFKREKTINLTKDKSGEINLVDQPAGSRHVNPSKVRCEIRYGKDNSVFELVKVSIDYIKAPQKIRLTPEQMDSIEDKSQILEWPESICQQIINELVMAVMENTADPRLQTNMAINQTGMTQPTQQSQKQAAQPAS